MPKILPSFFCLPLLVVGIHVAFAMLRLAEVTPRARFQLKDKPGIELFFFDIIQSPFLFNSSIIPAVIMLAGRAIIAIPKIDESIVTIFPAVETG